MARWELYDPVTADTYEFEINPNKMKIPDLEKGLLIEHTTAPDGQALIMEGADRVREGSFAGILLEQSQNDEFEEWWGKRYQVRLTDDQGTVLWVYLKSLSRDRRATRHYPWRREYTISFVVLDVLNA